MEHLNRKYWGGILLLLLRFVLISACLANCSIVGVAQSAPDSMGVDQNDTVQARLFLEEGKLLVQEKKYEAAIRKLDLARSIFSQTLGSESKELAEVLYQISLPYYYLRNYNKAIEVGEESLRIKVKAYGENNLEVASVYNILGITYRKIGNYNKAIACLDSCLKIRSELLGTMDLSVARAHGNIANVYLDVSDFNNAIDHLSEAMRIIQHSPDMDDSMLANAYVGLGNAYSLNGKHNEAIDNFNLAVQIFILLNGEENPDVGMCYNNIANAYNDLGEFQTSVKFHEKALAIRKKVLGDFHPDVAWSYNNYGNTLKNLGDLDRALAFHKLALSIRLKIFREPNQDVATSYLNIGNTYSEMGEYENAVKYFNESLSIFLQFFAENNINVMRVYTNLGNSFWHLGRFSDALDCHFKSLSISKNLLGSAHPDIGRSFLNIAIVYASAKEYEKALDYFQSAIENWEMSLGVQHPNIALAYDNIGMVYNDMKRFYEAEKSFNLGLNCVEYGNKSIEHVKSPAIVKELLYNLGLTYKRLFLSTSDNSFLDKSLSCFEKAIDLENYYGKYFDFDNRYSYSSKIHQLNEQCIALELTKNKIGRSLKGKGDAFRYSESSKSNALRIQIQDQEGLRFYKVPDSILATGTRLKRDIAVQDKKFQRLKDTGHLETDTAMLAVSNRIFVLKQDFEHWKKKLEIQYPNYYRLKYDLSTISIAEVQQSLLDTDQALLEYFTGDSSVFVFVLKKDEEPHIVEVKKDFPLEEWVDKFHAALCDENLTEQYTEYARKLYDALLAPVADQLPRRVIVIPDGVLGYIPFGALLSGEPEDRNSFQSFPFLVRKYQFSYCYSATLLKEMKEKQHAKIPSKQKQIAAFAPVYDGKPALLADRMAYDPDLARGLAPLPNAEPEAQNALNRIGNGDVFPGYKALKDTFMAVAPLYRILYLIMHGRADNRQGDYSFLAFTQRPAAGDDGLLYVRDLYNLPLNADLAVLSACETGIGKLRRGEGIISLARAFAYAGAKSMVSTLWSVSDARTADVMNVFFRELAAGADKDAALQTAQLEYLNQEPESNLQLHPKFWSAFIPVGDMQKLGE